MGRFRKSERGLNAESLYGDLGNCTVSSRGCAEESNLVKKVFLGLVLLTLILMKTMVMVMLMMLMIIMLVMLLIMDK